MNNELQQALAAAINKTTAATGAMMDKASGFLSAQLPDVIHQLLLWELVDCALNALAYSVFIAAYAVFARWVISNQKAIFSFSGDLNSFEFPAFMGVFLGGIISAMALVGVFTNIGNALQIWLAPKVFLIEYAAHLAK